ncbi:MAG: hypothetical protein M3P93_14420 [Actinomycetota bacterium]|jgi:hypothetical protein|nr:hypothetical protein [Actinomycetota bacterium]
MDLHWRPVGPLPAGVYWRRRGVLAAVVVLLLALLGRCTAGGDAPDELAQEPAGSAGSATPPPAADTTGSPGTSQGEARAADACSDELLTLQSDAAPARVPAGSATSLRLALTNTGSVACSRGLGQGAVELSVFAGPDRIWSSDDCAPGGPQDPVVLRPGEQRLLAVRWDGTRSRPGCAGERPAVGPGTYRVVARVGSLAREGRTFEVV